jgi:hypothetical protein
METGGTITKYSVYGYVASGTATVDMAAYTMYEPSPGAYNDPVTRIGTVGSPATITTTPGWRDTGTVSHSMTIGIAYCIAYGNMSADFELYYDDGVDYDFTTHNGSITLPETWVVGSYYATIKSIYATYTPSGGATPKGFMTTTKGIW